MKITRHRADFGRCANSGLRIVVNRNYFYLLVHLTDEGYRAWRGDLGSHDDSLLGVLSGLSDLVIGRDPRMSVRWFRT